MSGFSYHYNVIDSVTTIKHEKLRQLIHFIRDGPGEGFSGAYCEITPIGIIFPTTKIWYESIAKVKKIIERNVVWGENACVIEDQWKMYDSDGITVLITLTDTISYQGIMESNRIRIIT